jgi:hypothetical protein
LHATGLSATKLRVGQLRQQQKPIMRLLNTSSWKLEDFNDSEIPEYAILSHRWEKEEITFQDLQAVPTVSETKKGWSKLKGCCAQAVRDKFEWVWIDTCCINKSSSAELSEAINSMFNWYKEAQVCYAYLSDVSLAADESSLYKENSSFRSSKWFTRGWTLQELLAPENLLFFDNEWKILCGRDDMWRLVSDITGIQCQWRRQWNTSSVAQKMSWASRRETTRIEDRAYSLMGLFGVNMPPLYGEREDAFLRLQLEILRMSDDESIFAWQDPKDLNGGLLANSPNAFERSHGIGRFHFHDQPPYWMTNKGLRLERPLLQLKAQTNPVDSDDILILPLQCDDQSSRPYGVLIQRRRADQFARIFSGELFSIARFSPGIDPGIDHQTQTIYVKQAKISFSPIFYSFSLSTIPLSSKKFFLTNQYSSFARWNDVGGERRTQQLSFYDLGGQTGALEFTKISGRDSAPFKLLERIVVIVNVYANRSRVAVYLPNNDLSLDQMITDLIEPGDWLTKKSHLFGPPKLKNGREISFKLVRDDGMVGGQGYIANVCIPDSVESVT